MNKIKYIFYSFIFILIPKISYAYSEPMSVDEFIKVGAELVVAVSIAICKGMILITAIQIIHFFITNRHTTHKLFEILRQCIIVILGMYILPKIPMLLDMLL